jgi:hypothetical protein
MDIQELTFAQKAILEMAEKKTKGIQFQDHLEDDDYTDYYDDSDYNDDSE